MKPWNFVNTKQKMFRIGACLMVWSLCAWTVTPPVFSEEKKAPSSSSPQQEFPKAEKTAGAIDLPTTFEDGLNKTIYLDLRDINVVDVFKFLATQGNLNIVTSKSVQGRSTLLLRNVKIRDALDILVIANQLAYEIRNDIIYVMSEEEYATAYGKNFNDIKKVVIRTLKNAKPSYVLAALQAVQSSVGKVIIDEDTGTVVLIDTPQKLLQMGVVLDQVENSLEMKTIQLQYAKVEDVVAQLKTQLEAKGVGTVIGDARSNQIILSAYPERMTDAVKLVKALDKQTKGVLIETRILQLTLNPKFDLAVNWQKVFRSSGWHNLTLGNTFPLSSDVTSVNLPNTSTSVAKSGRIAIGDFANDEVAALFQAVKGIEETKVLANPRVMTLDRQEAKMNIGDRIPYVVTTSTGTGNNVSVSEDIRFIDVGIMMTVLPTINENGFVTMKIRPEISSRTGDLTTPTNNIIPKVNTTYVESTVIVQNGVSVVLGGLMRDDQNRSNQGIPYLMDIPLFGNLFQGRHESIKKTEIVIIITPHIVTGEKDVLDQPIQIKGRSSGNARTAEFQTTTLDVYTKESADTVAAQVEEKVGGGKSAAMGQMADGLSRLATIKRAK